MADQPPPSGDSKSGLPVQYDLTQTISSYLDRHMVLLLVEYLEMKEMYPADDLLKTKLDVVSRTKMEFTKIQIQKQVLETENPPDKEEKIKLADEQYNEAKTCIEKEYKIDSATEFIENVVNAGLTDPNVTSEEIFDFKKKNMIDNDNLMWLFKFAKLAFEIGQYKSSWNSLSAYRILSTDDDTSFLALWGKIAAGINTHEVSPEDVIADVKELGGIIDRRFQVPMLQQLMQRAWLVNWALFVYMSKVEYAQEFVEFVLQDKILNAVQTRCPYILRYVVAAVFVAYDKNRKDLESTLTRVLQMEKDRYRDPLTEFLRNLFVNYDFEAAHQQLVECEKVFDVDFFLNIHTEEVEEDGKKIVKNIYREQFFRNARKVMFELYCRIHKRIDISLLAKRLHLDEKDTDKALVKLVRDAPFEGKINSEKNHLVIATKYPSIYQKVIDKTKQLYHRTHGILDAIKRKRQQKEPMD